MGRVARVDLVFGIVFDGEAAPVDGGQLGVAARRQRLAGVHVRGDLVVGQNEAVEAPLFAQDAGDEVVIAARPGGPDAVEGRHDGGSRGDDGRLGGVAGDGAFGVFDGLVVLDLDGVVGQAHFKRLEIDLADGLFVCPGDEAQMVAVLFLIVEGEVLEEGVHALLRRPLDGLFAHGAGEEAVFGIILEVAAGKRGAVDVDGGAVPTDDAGIQAVFADAPAHFEGVVHFPGAGEQVLGGPGHGHEVVFAQGRGTVVDHFVEAGGAVEVGDLGFIDRFRLGRAVAAFGDQFGNFVDGQLVEEIFPQRVVEGLAAQVDEVQPVVGAEGHLFRHGALIGVAGRLRIELRLEACIDGVRELLAADLFGAVDGGRAAVAQAVVFHHGPVGTGEVDGAFDGGIVEAVGDLPFAVFVGIGSVRFGVRFRLHIGADKGCVTIPHHLGKVDGSIAPFAPCREDVVDRLVRVFRRGHIVVAFFEDVRLVSFGIVRSEVFGVDDDLQRLRFVRGEVFGLIEADEGDRRLFYPVFDVVLGVRGLHVDLHHVFAVIVARVGDGDGDGHVAIFVGGGHGEIGPFEGGVGKAVAEGIGHRGGVVVAACAFAGGDHVFVAGLVVLIADVDALGVVDVIVICPLVVVVAHVLHGGGREVVVHEGIDEVAGRRDLVAVFVLADQRAAEAVHARAPRARHVDDGGDVLVLFHPAQLHRVVAVDEQDDVVKGVVEVRDDLQLRLVRLEIMLAGLAAEGSHVARLVAALAARAGEDEHGGGAAEGGGQGMIGGDDAERAFVDAPVGAAAVVDDADAARVRRAGAAFIEVPQRLVDF